MTTSDTSSPADVPPGTAPGPAPEPSPPGATGGRGVFAGLDPQLRRLALVVVLGSIMSILDTTIVNVAIPTFARDFRAPLSTVQWVSTGYLLALAMTIPLTGLGGRAVRRQADVDRLAGAVPGGLGPVGRVLVHPEPASSSGSCRASAAA